MVLNRWKKGAAFTQATAARSVNDYCVLSASNCGARFIGERGGEVTFAGGAADRDDELAFVLGTLCDLDSGADIRPGADAAEDALLFGKAPGHREGGFVADFDALDDLIFAALALETEVCRDEPGTGALDFVGAGGGGLTGEGLGDDR